MNPKLKPVLLALGVAVLFLYVGTFLWFAYSALFGEANAAGNRLSGPLNADANEVVAYVWTTVSLLVGGVVAIAFGQQPPRQMAVTPLSVEQLVVAYAWAFMGVGLSAIVVWILASSDAKAPEASTLVKNAAVAFFGLAIPILTSFLRLPPEPRHFARTPDNERSLTFRAICIDFSFLPDDTPLPDTFAIAGFMFEKATGGRPWFVNSTAGERGLMFDDNGGTINLPEPVAAIELRVGAFGGSFDIEALNAEGSVVGRTNVSGNNKWSDHRVDAKGIVSISFKGGNYEAAIQKICV